MTEVIGSKYEWVYCVGEIDPWPGVALAVFMLSLALLTVAKVKGADVTFKILPGKQCIHVYVVSPKK